MLVGFAGFGGWCEGARQAGAPPRVAVNHWPHAIALHQINHPGTIHYCEDVHQVDIRTAAGSDPVWWIHVSPDCTHFSRAKGAKPRLQKIRALAWILVDWARATGASVLSLENVVEFLGWGPLGDDGRPLAGTEGEEFRAFIVALRALGYAVEWRELCAADFGAPTTRRRLFLLARRDGQAIRWPAPTHGRGLMPYSTAADCIDWSVPTRSILGRPRPLADATCRRIAAGLMRFARPVAAAPHVQAWIAKHYTGVIGQPLDRPLGTITAVDHHSLCTATTGPADHPGARQVAGFLTSYYSGGGTAAPLDRPMPTITATARHGLVACTHDGQVLVDIGLRMLTPRELARAQGFPDSYQLAGTVAEQIRCIGNSVVPAVAAALVRANLPDRAAA
jgi:DNA (cytosine-5)-methyltransferase 1